MEKELKKILKELDSEKVLFQDFSASLTQLINSLLSTSGIRPHQFYYRIKERESIEKKVTKKDSRYKKLSEITDICGLRIVTYFDDDIDKIATVLLQEFDVDRANSIDQRILKEDWPAHSSIQYVFRLKKNRLKLTEYKRFKGLKAEIQVRNILQHSWLEIENYLGYKVEKEIPPTAKRIFHRINVLLEKVDIEFARFKQQIQEQGKKVAIEIAEDPGSVMIDKSSLLSFARTNKFIQEFEESVEKTDKIRGGFEPVFLINIIPKLKRLKITNIKQLEEIYKANLDKIMIWAIPELENLREEQLEPITFLAGASIVWLCKVLEADGGQNT